MSVLKCHREHFSRLVNDSMCRPLVCLFLVSGMLLNLASLTAEAAAPQAPAASPLSQITAHKGLRKLAPGVLTVVSPAVEEQDTFSGPREIVEIVSGVRDLDWSPALSPQSYTLSKISRIAIFRRPVWQLEFAFKPVRMIQVDVPQPSGKMQRKRIWYMVYRVRNTGHHLQPVAQPDEWDHETYGYDRINHSIRFFPQFLLKSREFDKSYMDRVIPAAIRPIREREDPRLVFHNSVEISKLDILVSTPKNDRSVWGLVTWENIDPHIDFFSVYVTGLTNAFRFEDPEGAFKSGDPPGTGRSYSFRTLQLNFWRPGDAVNEHEAEIRYGIPDEVDYRWVYR